MREPKCLRCGGPVELVEIDEAAKRSGLSPGNRFDEVARLLEREAVERKACVFAEFSWWRGGSCGACYSVE